MYFTIDILSPNDTTDTYINQINYAPLFYSKPKDFMINAGKVSSMTLPRYYDPNPVDTIKLTFKIKGSNKTAFI